MRTLSPWPDNTVRPGPERDTMSDSPTPLETSPEDGCSGRRGRRGRRRGLFAGLILGGLLVTGASAIAAGPGGFGHHGACGDGELTVEAVEARMGRAADRMLDEVDATDAQRAEVDALIVQTAPEVVAHRKEGQVLRDALMTELARDQVDPARVEQLRQDGLALVEDGSAEHLDTLLALADILDGDQRQALIALAQDWHR